MQSAFISPSTRFPSVHSRRSPVSSSRLPRGEKKRGRGGDGAKKGGKVHGGDASFKRQVTHKHTRTHTHTAFLLFITRMRTRTHPHTHTASTLRSCRCVLCIHTHQSRSNDKAKKTEGHKGAKKGGSPRLSGMTKKKSRHSKGRIKRKPSNKKRHARTLFPNLPLTIGEMGMNRSQREGEKKKKRKKRSTKC